MRINESKLANIVAESIKKVLKEEGINLPLGNGMKINKKTNGIVSYDAFKSWDEAGRLRDFYNKFSKRMDACVDEFGLLAACTNDDGDVLWVNSDGCVGIGDERGIYDDDISDEPLGENKETKNRIVKENDEKRQEYVSFMNYLENRCEAAYKNRLIELGGNDISDRDMGFIKEGIRIAKGVALDAFSEYIGY